NPGAGGQHNNAGATRSIRRSARPTVARGGGRHTGDNALAYPYPANVPGWSSGDLSTMSGCVAWHLSVGDLLTVMAAFRRRGVIVDRPSWLLDAFALALTDRISGMASGAAGRARISHKVCDCEPLHTFPGSAGLASPTPKRCDGFKQETPPCSPRPRLLWPSSLPSVRARSPRKSVRVERMLSAATERLPTAST